MSSLSTLNMMVVMLNNFFAYSVLFVCLIALPLSNARAEQCSIHYEMVTKLHHPDPGSYSVWENIYGEGQKDEAFISVINKDGGALAVGEMYSLKGARASMMLVEIDKRGRVVWEKYHSISGLKNVVKMLEHGDGVVVLANRHKAHERASLWLGFFDGNGVLKAQKIIKNEKHDLFANDIIQRINAKGWALSVSVEREIGTSKNKMIRKNAALYLLDENGNELSSRAYILGTNNEISSLSVAKFEGKSKGRNVGYIATGYFESPTGQKIGWVLRLNDDTSYIWQKEYSRGLSAKLKLSSGYHDGNILVFGDVRPVTSGAIGSWLMMLDGNSGETLWQRYYYGESLYHDYLAKGLYVNGDGLITVMMMAVSTDKSVGQDSAESKSVFDKNIPDKMDYAHLLTLSPRGVTFSGDAYYFGQGVSISQLIEGEDGSRVMAGYAFVPAENIFDEKARENAHPSPLKEEGSVYLPDVELSEKANKGLAMLKNKVKAQDMLEVAHGKSDENSDGESAKLTKNGWVVIGDMPEAYTDPCVRTIKGLK